MYRALDYFVVIQADAHATKVAATVCLETDTELDVAAPAATACAQPLNCLPSMPLTSFLAFEVMLALAWNTIKAAAVALCGCVPVSHRIEACDGSPFCTFAHQLFY